MIITEQQVKVQVTTHAGVEHYTIRKSGSVYKVTRDGQKRVIWTLDSMPVALNTLQEYENLSK